MSATWFSGLGGGTSGGADGGPGDTTPGPPPVRLFCFPHAGGGIRFYAPWRSLGPQVQVCAIVLPGRDGRLLETPYTDMGALVTDLTEALRPHLTDAPFAFFGHSLGAAVAYETILRLRELGLPQPACLFASGRRAPHSPVPAPYSHRLSDDDLISEVGRLGGLPDKARQRPRAMRAMLPSLRADYRLNDTYVPTDCAPVDLPIHGYAGDRDPIAAPAHVAGWQAVTTGRFRLRVWPGDHFYLRDAPPPMVEAVRTDLFESLPQLSRGGPQS